MAHEFADLKDRSGRLNAEDVVGGTLEWKTPRRTYWYMGSSAASRGTACARLSRNPTPPLRTTAPPSSCRCVSLIDVGTMLPGRRRFVLRACSCRLRVPRQKLMMPALDAFEEKDIHVCTKFSCRNTLASRFHHGKRRARNECGANTRPRWLNLPRSMVALMACAGLCRNVCCVPKFLCSRSRRIEPRPLPACSSVPGLPGLASPNSTETLGSFGRPRYGQHRYHPLRQPQRKPQPMVVQPPSR